MLCHRRTIYTESIAWSLWPGKCKSSLLLFPLQPSIPGHENIHSLLLLGRFSFWLSSFWCHMVDVSKEFLLVVQSSLGSGAMASR